MWDRRTRELRLHHAGCRPTNATDRTSKARLCLNERSSGNPTASCSANAGTRNGMSRNSLSSRFFRRRRTLNGHRNNLFTTEENKA